ncbi:MAG TPA: flavodoxin domain-containing protein [Streptosporangiaceae bacterium]|nr:flavodoxin domain-containing protein [Streptosporangiaceae bacterium]
MRVLVVYESMYGNTHVIASNIAEGLRATHEVTLVPVADATADLVGQADLLVVGAPTHMHGMSTASSRQAARKAATKPDSGLMLDPDASGPALRDWLGALTGGHALAAAFDTRLAGAPMLTGRAGRGIGKALRRRGYRLIMPPESFVVTKLNTLVDGESSRARRWGAALAATAGLAVPAA